jgi:hypothetical protein
MSEQRRDRIISRLFMKKLELLLEEGEFDSQVGRPQGGIKMLRCVLCNEIFPETSHEKLFCNERIKILQGFYENDPTKINLQVW